MRGSFRCRVYGVVGGVLLSLCVAFPATAQLTFNVVNTNPNYSNTNVFFWFEGGVTGTINGHSIASQTSYSLADIGSGMLLSQVSGRLLVSLGEAVTNAVFSNYDIPSTLVRWDKLEITFSSTDPNSCANLTAADFASIPLQISTPSKTLNWHGYDSMSNVFSNLGAFSSNSGLAIYTNQQGRTLRVVSPSTVPQSGPNPYPSWQGYIDYVRTNNINTKVVNIYSIQTSNDLEHTTQRFQFSAQIAANGDLVLTGWGEKVGSNHTIRVLAANLDRGLYTADPPYILDGTNRTGQVNGVYDKVLHDVFAGFNCGLIGTAAIDPRTGQPFTNETTEFWFNENGIATNSLAATNVFGALWGPGTNFYNVYAAFLSTNSDAYGFPYTDAYAKPLLDLGTSNSLTLTILPDLEAVPEPSTVSYVGGALVLLALPWLARRKRS